MTSTEFEITLTIDTSDAYVAVFLRLTLDSTAPLRIAGPVTSTHDDSSGELAPIASPVTSTHDDSSGELAPIADPVTSTHDDSSGD